MKWYIKHVTRGRPFLETSRVAVGKTHRAVKRPAASSVQIIFIMRFLVMVVLSAIAYSDVPVPSGFRV